MLESIAIILSAIITVGLPFIINGYLQKRKADIKNQTLNTQVKRLLEENKQLIKEKKDLLAHEITGDLTFFTGIKDIIETLFEKTKVDRFLILTGHNGNTDLVFATAIYEQHRANPKILLSMGATRKYKNFRFDESYRKMIKSSENFGYIDYVVKDMEECELKEIYLTEEIKFVRVLFLLRTKIDETNDIVFFASLATHSIVEFSKRELSIMKAQGDLLMGLFAALEKEKLVESKNAEKELYNLAEIEKELNGKQRD